MKYTEAKISNWSNYPLVNGNVASTSELEEVSEYLREKSSTIARGNGRCYGDASLQNNVFSSLKLDKVISFEKDQGIIHCQSGILLSEILELIIPEGYFLPVTPGTKYITLGGAIASDIHGKNHHRDGCFSQHLIDFNIIIGDGSLQYCSPAENPDLFWATCGGMGLTGIITDARFSLLAIESSYIIEERVKTRNLKEVMEAFEDSSDWKYSVAWLDCIADGKDTGRSILLKGRHASKNELSGKAKSNPLKYSSSRQFDFPVAIVRTFFRRTGIKIFNSLYYKLSSSGGGKGIVPLSSFFYPLDQVKAWNRFYGPDGFTQYQFVLPKEKSYDGLLEILKVVSEYPDGAWLAVLKLLGKSDIRSILSFPQEGYTLALDFRMKPGIYKLLDRLDKIVLQYDGRVYLSKDFRMHKNSFENSYEDREKFKTLYDKFSRGKFKSILSKRLGLSNGTF